MTESVDNGSRKRGGKAKAKRKRKGRSYRDAAKKAREQSAEAIDPKVAIVAKDPLRSEILAIAIQRPISPSEFARERGISTPVSSYAFKVLKEHGIIELVELVKVRGTIKHMYRANESAFIGDKDWGKIAPILRPGVIGAAFGNFNGRVAEAEQTGKLYERNDVRIYWAPRELDEIAWKEHAKILAWVIEASEQLAADTMQRRAKGESDGSFRATIGLFLFPSPTHAEVKAHERKKRRQGRETEAEPKAKPKAAKRRTAGNREGTGAKGKRKARDGA